MMTSVLTRTLPFAVALVFDGFAYPAAAQREIRDTRWLESVRENVLTLQERHQDRALRAQELRQPVASVPKQVSREEKASPDPPPQADGR